LEEGRPSLPLFDRELHTIREIYTSVVDPDQVRTSREDLLRPARINGQSVSPDSIRGQRQDGSYDREPSMRFMSIETSKIRREPDARFRNEFLQRQVSQLASSFQARVISKFKKFMNKNLKGQLIEPWGLNTSRATINESPSKFRFYQKAKMLNAIFKTGKFGHPFMAASPEREKSSVGSNPEAHYHRSDTGNSVGTIKDEILKQKIGVQETELLLAEKSKKVTELKRVNECLLNEIERKERHLERLEVSRTPTERETTKSPRHSEGGMGLEKTLHLLQEKVKEKDEQIARLKSKLEAEESLHNYGRSVNNENDLRKSKQSNFGNHSDKEIASALSHRFHYQISKSGTYFHPKRSSRSRWGLWSVRLFARLSNHTPSLMGSNRQNSSNEMIQANEVDARFTFGQKGSNINEMRLEHENSLLRINSQRLDKLTHFAERIRLKLLGRVDRASKGLEEIEARIMGLGDLINGVRFVCQQMQFKASRLAPIIQSITGDLEFQKERVLSFLDIKLSKNKTRYSALKEKLGKIRNHIGELAKTASHFRSVRSALEIEPCQNQLQLCLAKIRDLNRSSWLVEVMTKQFNLSSTREAQTEEIQQLKKAEELMSLCEQNFKISFESESIRDVVKAFMDDHHRSQLLEQVTSLLDMPVDPEDTSSTERFLTGMMKVKIVLKNLETETQNSFKNLSSQEISDFFHRSKAEAPSKLGDALDRVKRVIADVLKPPFIDENNFEQWLTKFCEELMAKQDDYERDIEARSLENQKLIDRFIEMQTEICNLKEQLENKSKHLEQEKKKLQEPSLDNAKTESLKIKIKNMQKNISDLERKLDGCREVLAVVGLNPNDKDLVAKFEERMEEFRNDPSLIPGKTPYSRKQSNQKKGANSNAKELALDALADFGTDALSLYISEHRGGPRERSAMREEILDNSASEKAPSRSQKKSYFVKSFLNIGNKK
jgi:predicted RNase H-like nuclease (RuvC/YqgF family)